MKNGSVEFVTCKHPGDPQARFTGAAVRVISMTDSYKNSHFLTALKPLTALKNPAGGEPFRNRAFKGLDGFIGIEKNWALLMARLLVAC
jgi:hypothetical protein